MKKSFLIYAFALIAGVMLYSCKPNDSKLQEQVKTVLTAVNPSLDATVKDGVATLSGTVETEEAKVAAETAAKAVKDIKSVTNNIEVKAPVVINPDDTIRTTITTALTNGGFKDIVATVSNGVVTLTGDVKKADLTKVMQIASEANVGKVENKLTIK